MPTVGPALPSETHPLRLAVLAPGGALAMTDAEAEPPAIHLAARDDGGRVIGSMHLAPKACPWRPDARATAEGFYLRQGFATVSEPFVEGDSGLLHVGMLRAL